MQWCLLFFGGQLLYLEQLAFRQAAPNRDPRCELIQHLDSCLHVTMETGAHQLEYIARLDEWYW